MDDEKENCYKPLLNYDLYKANCLNKFEENDKTYH